LGNHRPLRLQCLRLRRHDQTQTPGLQSLFRFLSTNQSQMSGSKKTKLSPWQRIVKAYDQGKGVHLSFEDVSKLNQDDAITTRARLDDEGLNFDPADDRSPSNQ
jgi:hypothetical protein